MTEGAPCGKRAPGGLAVPLEAQSSPQGRRGPPLPHSQRLPQTREGGAAPWAHRRFASPLAGHVPSAPAPRWTSVRRPHHERLLRGGGARRVFTGGKTVFPFHSCMPSLTSLPRTPRCPAMRSLSLRGADQVAMSSTNRYVKPQHDSFPTEQAARFATQSAAHLQLRPFSLGFHVLSCYVHRPSSDISVFRFAIHPVDFRPVLLLGPCGPRLFHSGRPYLCQHPITIIETVKI